MPFRILLEPLVERIKVVPLSLSISARLELSERVYAWVIDRSGMLLKRRDTFSCDSFAKNQVLYAGLKNGSKTLIGQLSVNWNVDTTCTDNYQPEQNQAPIGSQRTATDDREFTQE